MASPALRPSHLLLTVGGTDADVAVRHREGVGVLVTGVDGDRFQVAS